MAQRFTSCYRSKRCSVGYRAWPELEDRARIWKLLKPEEIGVQLIEGFMTDPEASVSALVFHRLGACFPYTDRAPLAEQFFTEIETEGHRRSKTRIRQA